MCTWPALPEDAAAELVETLPKSPDAMQWDTRLPSLPVNTASDLPFVMCSPTKATGAPLGQWSELHRIGDRAPNQTRRRWTESRRPSPHRALLVDGAPHAVASLAPCCAYRARCHPLFPRTDGTVARTNGYRIDAAHIPRVADPRRSRRTCDGRTLRARQHRAHRSRCHRWRRPTPSIGLALGEHPTLAYSPSPRTFGSGLPNVLYTACAYSLSQVGTTSHPLPQRPPHRSWAQPAPCSIDAHRRSS